MQGNLVVLQYYEVGIIIVHVFDTCRSAELCLLLTLTVHACRCSSHMFGAFGVSSDWPVFHGHICVFTTYNINKYIVYISRTEYMNHKAQECSCSVNIPMYIVYIIAYAVIGK